MTYEPETIERIIAFIRHHGYDEVSKKWPASIPKGIVVRKVGDRTHHPYQYTYEHPDGKRSKHFATTLEGAIQGMKEGPPTAGDGAPDDEDAMRADAKCAQPEEDADADL